MGTELYIQSRKPQIIVALAKFLSFFKFEIGNSMRLAMLTPVVLIAAFVVAGGFGQSFYQMTAVQRLIQVIFWAVFCIPFMACVNTFMSFALKKVGLPLFYSVGLTSPIVALVGAYIDTSFGYAPQVFPESPFRSTLIVSFMFIFVIGATMYYPRRKMAEQVMEKLYGTDGLNTRHSTSPLQEHLSASVSGKILEIRAQDKYCLIRTSNGSELVHITFMNACLMAGETEGTQIHRSHWLNYDEMDRIRYTGGNPKMILRSGQERPVGRRYAKSLNAKLKTIRSG